MHRATTWAGYVGVLTGVRNQGFSVSVNYRRTELGALGGVGGIVQNLKRGISGHWPEMHTAGRRATQACLHCQDHAARH